MGKSDPRLRLPWYAHVPVWLYAAALVAPLFFVVVSAGKNNLEIFTRPFYLPINDFQWSNFSEAWTRTQMGLALLNSVLVVTASLAVNLLLALPAAYSIARWRGRGGRISEAIFALGLLIPGFAALVPTVLMSIAVGMYQNRGFLVAVFAATSLPLAVILLAQFMRSVPDELEESAMLDGANRLRILWHVYLPVIVPGMATISILNFLGFWNEYLFSLVLLGGDPQLRTVQVALPTLASRTETHYGILMAGTLISIIPVLIVYVALQKQIEKALVDGAVKS